MHDYLNKTEDFFYFRLMLEEKLNQKNVNREEIRNMIIRFLIENKFYRKENNSKIYSLKNIYTKTKEMLRSLRQYYNLKDYNS